MPMKLKNPIGGSHNIPASFWDDVTPEEIGEICENDSCLTPRLKARLYRMLDMQNPPEGEIQIMVSSADVERLVREAKREP